MQHQQQQQASSPPPAVLHYLHGRYLIHPRSLESHPSASLALVLAWAPQVPAITSNKTSRYRIGCQVQTGQNKNKFLKRENQKTKAKEKEETAGFCCLPVTSSIPLTGNTCIILSSRQSSTSVPINTKTRRIRDQAAAVAVAKPYTANGLNGEPNWTRSKAEHRQDACASRTPINHIPFRSRALSIACAPKT